MTQPNKLMIVHSREYYLLQEIESRLQMYKNKEPRDIFTSIETHKLAEFMAWAQIGLREYVIQQNQAIDYTNKHPDVTEARIRLADGDFLGKEESERIMGEILSKT